MPKWIGKDTILIGLAEEQRLLEDFKNAGQVDAFYFTSFQAYWMRGFIITEGGRNHMWHVGRGRISQGRGMDQFGKQYLVMHRCSGTRVMAIFIVLYVHIYSI